MPKPPRPLLALAALAALAGCTTATPYQAFAPGRGGYAERQLGNNSYRVVFSGNAATSAEAVGNGLLRRAAELTRDQGATWFRVSQQATEGEVREIDTRLGRVRVSRGAGYGSWRNYGSFYTASGLGFIPALFRRARGREALEASAIIEIGRGEVPSGEGVFTASEVLARLR